MDRTMKRGLVGGKRKRTGNMAGGAMQCKRSHGKVGSGSAFKCIEMQGDPDEGEERCGAYDHKEVEGRPQMVREG